MPLNLFSSWREPVCHTCSYNHKQHLFVLKLEENCPVIISQLINKNMIDGKLMGCISSFRCNGCIRCVLIPHCYFLEPNLKKLIHTHEFCALDANVDVSLYPHAGLQGEEHGPHAARHRGAAEEQQERLRLRPDGHRPDRHLPLGGAARLLQGPGGLQGGREETQAEEGR